MNRCTTVLLCTGSILFDKLSSDFGSISCQNSVMVVRIFTVETEAILLLVYSFSSRGFSYSSMATGIVVGNQGKHTKYRYCGNRIDSALRAQLVSNCVQLFVMIFGEIFGKSSFICQGSRESVNKG